MLLLAGLMLGIWRPVTGVELPIAGTAPAERPVGAPSIRVVEHDRDWYRQALRGIDKPYPKSLRFLEDQGNWYTPFDRPGMTGPYDLRNLHR
jgi:hypothetical protein